MDVLRLAVNKRQIDINETIDPIILPYAIVPAVSLSPP